MIEPIPAFEGHPVDGTSLKISGAIDGDDLNEVVVSVDDVVQLRSLYKVVGIYHRVDKSGRLIRDQYLRPIEVQLVPIDPSNPDDEGIMRALPRPAPRELGDG